MSILVSQLALYPSVTLSTTFRLLRLDRLEGVQTSGDFDAAHKRLEKILVKFDIWRKGARDCAIQIRTGTKVAETKRCVAGLFPIG